MTVYQRQLNTYECMGDDGSLLTVIELQHMLQHHGATGVRLYPGARHLVLSTGQAVRQIDLETFEVAETGEVLQRHG